MVRAGENSRRTRASFARAASKLLADTAKETRHELEKLADDLGHNFAMVVGIERAGLRKKLSDREQIQGIVENQVNLIQAHQGVKQVKIRAGEEPTVSILIGPVFLSDHTSNSRFEIGEIRIELFPDGRKLGHSIRNLSDRKISRPMKGMQTPYVGASGKVVHTNVMTPLPILIGRLELYQAFKLILQGATRYNEAHPWNTFLSDWIQ